MSIPVQLKILDDRIIEKFGLPDYATDMSAGLDLVACIDEPVIIEPGKTILIPTGISVYVGDQNFASIILPRSGLGHKKGLVLGNGTGLIDADYQGPLMVSAWNRNSAYRNDTPITVNPGDRIAQLVFLPIVRASFEIVDDFLKVTSRGEGGFGSTGVAIPAVKLEELMS